MKPLRIVHVLPSFKFGGQERVALDLARVQRRDGHQVVAIEIDPRPEPGLEPAFHAAEVQTRAVRKRGRFDPTLVVRLAALFARGRFDVVHTHNPQPLVYAAPAGRLAGAVVVHTKHGENLESTRRVILRRAMAAFADAFVAVSPLTADSARLSRDVTERKLRVIPNGIDVRRFGPDPDVRRAVRRELHVPEDAWLVGTVGRLASEKNQVLLVRALAGALGERARLVLVGDGQEAEAIRRAVGEAGAGRWVHLTGARPDVPRYLCAFDVFALPSLSEGLPLVVLEAMATALPVVASAVGGLPDVVADGITGLLVPSGDAGALRKALLGLAAAPARAAALGAHAREYVTAHHSLERVSGDYMALYTELLRRKGRLPRAAGDAVAT